MILQDSYFSFFSYGLHLDQMNGLPKFGLDSYEAMTRLHSNFNIHSHLFFRLMCAGSSHVSCVFPGFHLFFCSCSFPRFTISCFTQANMQYFSCYFVFQSCDPKRSFTLKCQESSDVPHRFAMILQLLGQLVFARFAVTAFICLSETVVQDMVRTLFANPKLSLRTIDTPTMVSTVR